MTSRLDLRPIIKTKEFEKSTDEEKFQTITLRPILKLQNDLFLGLFKNHITESKVMYYSLSPENKVLFIENSLQKNIVLKNKLIGVTLGMLTIEELAVYSADTNLYNKRIMSLLIERIRSQISLLV
ncbi:glyoxalase [Algoriphagus lutimaris]|uniref:glyoxalase n=1 Tax=Algoriphagus lutimaris TaxID=613197 RepID=UPI00196A6CCE|nr:glyoxalase [Algoriphagus lutimaris]MBN3522025.1 glyoxalase [Algoriphagus lutimaris]